MKCAQVKENDIPFFIGHWNFAGNLLKHKQEICEDQVAEKCNVVIIYSIIDFELLVLSQARMQIYLGRKSFEAR